jgi:hypothetical protein
MEMVDEMTGLFLTGIGELAGCTPDLAARREFEKATHELRRKIAAKARAFGERRETT